MITFYLLNPKREKSTIYMLVSFKSTKYRRTVGESVPVKFWNKAKKRAKVTAAFPYGNDINEVIDKWEAAGLRSMAFFKDHYSAPSQEEFFERLDKEYYKPETITEEKTIPTFIEYVSIYMDRYRKVRSESTLKKWNTARIKLKQYEKERKRTLKFEDINIDFYNDFQYWFYKKGYKDNYFGTIIKFIKQVYTEARVEDHYHSLTAIEHKDFVTVNEDSDSVYLTEEELTKIHELDLTPELILEHFPDLTPYRVQQKIKSLKIARDRFLIGAYTGLRVSDFSRLHEMHFGDFIHIKTEKTGSDTVIPVHPIIKEIIDRGFDPKIKITEQKIRKRVKELAQMAGVTQKVLITHHIGGKLVEEVNEKYKLISTHTARRSFATNAYKAGVPTLAIMKITGHKKESTFLKYIKVSAQENAETLQEHPFFNSK